MGINLVALIWGFAEASLFFIVPDVWLSFAGREKLSKGIRACVFALAGALIGGAVMYAGTSARRLRYSDAGKNSGY
jgi:membrane protein YqaA with SNARE-associated domain